MNIKYFLYTRIVSFYKLCGKTACCFHTAITRLRLVCYGAKVGKRLIVQGWIHLHISPKAQVVLGDDVMLTSGFAGNPTACSLRTGLWCLKNAKLEIGDNTGIFGSTILCSGSVTIGSNVLIAGGTHIYDNDFHSLDPAIRHQGIDENIPPSPVRIGDQCWIGSRCIILKGVTIGYQSVIGSGSVVTKDIPPRQLWAGNPARFVKEL